MVRVKKEFQQAAKEEVPQDEMDGIDNVLAFDGYENYEEDI